ncbi:MAG TPA: hypothetical protein VFA78_09600 [Chloroflexota bacterium]|nr:hypothetical protein [Chloroflexota bacterium]
MFVFGLLIGPAIGLALTFAGGDGNRRSRVAVIPAVLVLLFIVFAGFIPLELKLGLIFGTLLGLLLGATPWRAETATS